MTAENPDSMTVRELVELHKKQMLRANPEYQRGVVWKGDQKKKLIDSVLRGYPLPRIYLHHVSESYAGFQNDRLEIIDGQQRITALSEFAQGAFKLFDPKEDDAIAKFPAFIRDEPCDSGHKNFDGLSEELKTKFWETKISIARIETDNTNEVRDLFVRLQGGMPLSAQERRDALPGQFTDYILKLGGKPELARYPGHEFFTKTLGMKPGRDRGKTRQLAAQIAILFLNRRALGGDGYCDINAKAIDDFYYEHLDFDPEMDAAKRLTTILDKIVSLIQPEKHAKLRGHDAMHLVLLVDTLWDDYTRGWEAKLPSALDKFLSQIAEAKLTKDDASPSEFWTQYSTWTRVNSDRGDNIAKRNRFYLEKMRSYLAPLNGKDPKRLYGEVERTVLFYRQSKLCAVCDAPVSWSEAEIHHVTEHYKGGQTTLENGAMVHSKCHPKSKAQTQILAKKLAAQKSE